MPVFNSASYLEQAITSILNQTYTDIELIIIDDGSTDNSCSIIQKYAKKDSRIVCLSQPNQGISKTRNRLLGMANYELIAWMDADDIALPERLSKQKQFLEINTDIVAVGTGCEMIDDEGDKICRWHTPLRHADIDAMHINGFGGGIIFPASMMRKSKVIQIHAFDESLDGAEDLDLFLKLAEIGNLANIDATGLYYRQHLKSISHAAKEKIKDDNRKVVASACMRRKTKYTLPEKQLSKTMEYETMRKWGWWALKDENIKTARKYAIRAFVRKPNDIHNWKLLACAIRGY